MAKPRLGAGAREAKLPDGVETEESENTATTGVGRASEIFREKGEVEERLEQRWTEKTGQMAGRWSVGSRQGRGGWAPAGACGGSQVGFRLAQDHEQPSLLPPLTNKDQSGTCREQEVGASG